MNLDPSSFFPASSFGEIKGVAALTGGLSGSTLYSVTTATGEYVLRLQGSDRPAWKRAVAMQRLAADHGVAPALAFVDEDRGGAVSVKVSGMSFGAAAAQPSVRAPALASLVENLAKLHAIELTEPDEAILDRGALARSIWARQAGRAGFPGWAAGLEARLAETNAVLAGDPRKVFSHNDLHPTNAHWDGTRVWFLDWERAGLAHPYLDPATFSNFLNLPDDAAIALFGGKGSAGRLAVDAKEQQIFRAVRDFSRIVYGAVFLSLVSDLAEVSFASREETPALADCYKRMGAGKLDPGTPSGQALLGAAFLKQVE